MPGPHLLACGAGSDHSQVLIDVRPPVVLHVNGNICPCTLLLIAARRPATAEVCSGASQPSSAMQCVLSNAMCTHACLHLAGIAGGAWGAIVYEVFFRQWFPDKVGRICGI